MRRATPWMSGSRLWPTRIPRTRRCKSARGDSTVNILLVSGKVRARPDSNLHIDVNEVSGWARFFNRTNGVGGSGPKVAPVYDAGYHRENRCYGRPQSCSLYWA